VKKREEHSKEEIVEKQATPEPTGEQSPAQEAALRARVTELEQSLNSYKDQLLRKAAEFENYKKRIENDFSSIAKFSNEDLIVQLLPVLDDLQRSLKAGKEHPDYDTFYKGVELIYAKFTKILEGRGVNEVRSVGKPFDVYFHDALMEVLREDLPHHTVVDEVEKGYTLHGKVIRHAKVILSTQHDQSPPDSSSGNDAGNGPASSDGERSA